MGVFGRRRERRANAERDAIFGVAYVAYYTPGMFGGASTWISDSEKRGFMEKSKATTDQIRRARAELVDWMLLKVSTPAESLEASRHTLNDELLEDEFVKWLSDVTCNANVQPPLFDTEGLRAKMLEVPAIPPDWQSLERHVWRLEESRAHGSRLRNSMMRVTRGEQRSALTDLAAISEALEKEAAVASSSGWGDAHDVEEYCGLDECPHCSPP